MCAYCRHQTTHYTNQLAKETNKDMQKLAHLPLPSGPSMQVHPRPVVPALCKHHPSIKKKTLKKIALCWSSHELQFSKCFKVTQNWFKCCLSIKCLDLDETPSYLASHPDPSCLHMELVVNGALNQMGENTQVHKLTCINCRIFFLIFINKAELCYAEMEGQEICLLISYLKEW